jgi:nitroreductase/dihydropteridine reductase
MELLKGLKWRYATKKFDPTKKIDSKDLDQLKEAVQLSASSYGLQLFKVLIIEDPEIRSKLRKAAYGQSQLTDASQVFIFCNYTNVTDQDVDKFVELTSNTRKQDPSELKGHGDGMKNVIKGMTPEEINVWTGKQVYIALGTLLSAASELRIDSCPMEGFNANEFNEILGLKDKGLNAAVMATVGYRSSDDKYQHQAKVRKPIEDLYEII